MDVGLRKTVAIIAGLTNFDRATNPHPHRTDFAYEIRIRRMRNLAASVTSLEKCSQTLSSCLFLSSTNTTSLSGILYKTIALLC